VEAATAAATVTDPTWTSCIPFLYIIFWRAIFVRHAKKKIGWDGSDKGLPVFFQDAWRDQLMADQFHFFVAFVDGNFADAAHFFDFYFGNVQIAIL
jgi:hypothetical protein